MPFNKLNKVKNCFLKNSITSILELNQNRQIQFYNFWQQPFDEMYWNRWFMARPYLFKDKPNLKVGMFSVFGDRNIIKKTNCDINLFYSAENLKEGSHARYADGFLLEPKINLSMGFEYFENERYCRFPNWMDVFFVKQDEVKSICQRLRYPQIQNKNKFAACICSHDRNGLRSEMSDSFEQFSSVSYPGKFRHNDDSLMKDFGDDKMKYLQQFVFNICPENSNAFGYVTEKIFQAINVGCVPVYWGCQNRPEPDVLNWNAMILWNPGGPSKNKDTLKLIEDLMNSPKLMMEFLSQPRLLTTAEEYILDCMNDVENKVVKIIRNA